MKYLSTAQAADFLDLSKSTLDHWRALGKGPRFTKSKDGLIRYWMDDLRAYMEGVS